MGVGEKNLKVSIADAILFGFKPRHDRRAQAGRHVSIADAILFGFKLVPLADRAILTLGFNR